MPAYFVAVLLTCIIWLILFVLNRDTRKEMLIIGLILTPLTILDTLTVPTYWKPITAFNLPVGIEGFLFTFFITGIASVLYEIIFKKRYKFNKMRVSLCIIFTIPVAISGFTVYFFGLNIIYLPILGFTLTAITVLIRRPDLFFNAFMSSLLFCVVYISTFTLWISLTPESINWWNSAMLSSIRIGYVPLEEVLFSLSLGFFVGPLFKYLTEARVVNTTKSISK